MKKSRLMVGYIRVLFFYMNLLGKRGCCTIYAEVMNTGKHEHLVACFFAGKADITNIHTVDINKYLAILI
jgi:hypothetical protein